MRKHKVMKKCLSICLALLLCALPVSIYAAGETAQPAAPAEQKISDTLYEEFARLEAQGKNMAEEKISVWVWYKDVNQTQVDNITKARTGLTVENAAVDYAMPSPALLNSLQNEEPGSQAQMQAYLAATAQARALETQRADTLIMTRREVAREQYNTKSAAIIEETNLDEDDIIFKSQYAPAIIMKMTKEQITGVIENQNVEFIDLYVEPSATPCSVESTKETLNLNKIYAQIGLTGQDVKVGMFEYDAPWDDPELDPSRVTIVGDNVTQGGHPQHVAVVMAGRDTGIAPNILLYATNSNYANIEALITSGVKVINASWGTWAYGYTSLDRWFDHIAAQHNLLLVCSAGNEENKDRVFVRSPAMAFNTLAVGGYDDKDTGSNTLDDQLRPYSSYNHSGSYKPDVVAPTHNYSGGTSTAAPIVTGIVALMLELKPSLAYQPHLIKAILLASCQRKVLSHAGSMDETMDQGITRTQGAGAVDAWNAICIISQGQYGYGTLSSEESRHFVQPSYGASHMNVSVAWLCNNTASGDHSDINNVTAGTQHNIDLQVYRGNTLAGSSALANSSTEMAYIPLSSTSAEYELRLYKEDETNTESVKYAYAWSTNNMTYKESASTVQSAPTDGFFYIRNQNNGQYLTVDESTGQVTSAAFSGGRNQQWIIDKADNTRFTIKTRSLTRPGNLSKAVNGNGAVIDTDTEYPIQFSRLSSTGAYAITYWTGAVHLQLMDEVLQWASRGAPVNFQWHFERIGYQKGDVDLNGVLNIMDVTLIQEYALETDLLNDDQLYLADMDNSGTVTIMDAILLQMMLVDM